MRALIVTWIVCATVAGTSVALAAPKPKATPRAAPKPAASATPQVDADAKCQDAVRFDDSDEPEKALAVIEEGLALAPKKKALQCLLKLKGSILLKQRSFAGALAAYEAYRDTGLGGADGREVQKIIDKLSAVKSTFLDITLANGPAAIYLGSKTLGVFCTAAPSCHNGMLPGSYRVSAERDGFDRWTQQVTVEKGKTAKVAITMVEKPSLFTVRVAQSGAHVTVDDTDYGAPITVPAGRHRVVVALAGNMEERREVSAHDGKPVVVEVSLTPLVPIRVEPAGATLLLDDKPIAIEEGSLAVPPGAHRLVARAPGFHDQRIEIPADRSGDYMLSLELTRLEVVATRPPSDSIFTGRRKVALAVGGAGVVALASGAVLGVQSKNFENDAFALCPSRTSPCAGARKADGLIVSGQSRALQANVAFGVAGGAAVAAAVLWLTGAPESRVAVTPRLGAVAGLDLAVRF
jgi:PEGA domain-containing protein